LHCYLARKPSREFPGQKNAFQTARFPLDWGGADRYSHFGCLWFRKWRLGKFQQWQTSRFIHVMSLILPFAYCFQHSWEMTWRVGLKNSQLFWLTALIPLFGPLIYLCASTSISSWCRNTQHFSTSLKPAKNRQNYGQENCIVVVMGGFITYVLLLAPPLLQETLTLLKNLLTGQWADINPNSLLLLLVPCWRLALIYSCVLFIDGCKKSVSGLCIDLSGDAV